MSFLQIASSLGCAYTAWGPCFCSKGKTCKSCKTAEVIDDLGLDWDEEFKDAEKNNFKDPAYLYLAEDGQHGLNWNR